MFVKDTVQHHGSAHKFNYNTTVSTQGDLKHFLLCIIGNILRHTMQQFPFCDISCATSSSFAVMHFLCTRLVSLITMNEHIRSYQSN
eukprot:c24962_g9_i1 orf=149-409(-)